MKLILSTIAALILLLMPGCSTPASRFPIGLWGVPQEDLSIVAGAGFTHVKARGKTPGYLDYAHRLGLKVILAGASTNALAGITSLKEEDAHPASSAWYIFDEPDLNGLPAPTLAQLHGDYKKAGARKPTAIALMDSMRTEEYANSTDIIFLDHYPVPWAPLSRFAAEMETARSYFDGPLFGIMQAFDWAYMPAGMIDETNQFRIPTAKEIRCMAYMGCAADLDGLFFYTYESRSWRVREHPTWEHVTNVVAEIRRNLPLFTAQHLESNVEVEYRLGAPSTNEMERASLTLARLRITISQPGWPRGEYLLCINTLSTPLPVKLKLPSKIQLQTRDEKPSEKLVDEIWRTFEPFEVAIYRVQRRDAVYGIGGTR